MLEQWDFMLEHNSCRLNFKAGRFFFSPTTGFARDTYHNSISASVTGGCHPEGRIRLVDSMLPYFLFFPRGLYVGCC